MDDFDDAAAEEVLDGADILDTAGYQLARLSVIVKGERQVVDAVVHGVAEVIPDVGRSPLGEIALGKIEQGNSNPQPEQEKRRAGQIPDLAVEQPVVDHSLQDPRNDKRQPRDGKEGEEIGGNVPEVRFDEDAQAKQVFHRMTVRSLGSIEFAYYLNRRAYEERPCMSTIIAGALPRPCHL